MSSCSFFGSEQKDEPIARVYDTYLYQSDITGIGKGAAHPEDSIQAVQNYIDAWIRHNLLLHYAQDNLSEQDQQLNDQLRNYKESLLIYLYEQNLLNQKLDTTVSEEEIKKYYDENKDQLDLKTSIAEVKYIMLPAINKIKLDSVRTWMKKSSPYNFPKLRSFCNEDAIKYSIADSIWFDKEQLLALLPADNFNFDNAVFNDNYLETADSNYLYLIKFNGYRIKGNDAPVEFVRNDIINIILNKRKLEFISDIQKNIYTDALENGDFQIFIPDSVQRKKQ